MGAVALWRRGRRSRSWSGRAARIPRAFCANSCASGRERRPEGWGNGLTTRPVSLTTLADSDRRAIGGLHTASTPFVARRYRGTASWRRVRHPCRCCLRHHAKSWTISLIWQSSRVECSASRRWPGHTARERRTRSTAMDANGERTRHRATLNSRCVTAPGSEAD